VLCCYDGGSSALLFLMGAALQSPASGTRTVAWTGAWTANKTRSRLSKIGILAISTSPVTLQLFFIPSDYCVVPIIIEVLCATLVFDGLQSPYMDCSMDWSMDSQ